MAAFQFPVRQHGESRAVDAVWVVPPGRSEAALLASWSSLVGSQTQIDAGELAALAAQKWNANCKLGSAAKSLPEMEAKVRRNPEIEITAMLLACADWSEPGVLGVCLFHRTWANNVFLDFLAAHPRAMEPASRISGIGTGLLSCLCEVARRLDSETLWLETTPGSAPFYRNIFQLPEKGDVLAISRAQREAFTRRLDEMW